MSRTAGVLPGVGAIVIPEALQAAVPDGWFDLHRRNGMPLFEGVVPAGDLQREDDPWSWHAFPDAPRVGVRRHRRIDIWNEPDAIGIDAFFRDAC